MGREVFVRVLLTNGTKVASLGWIRHRGKAIQYGMRGEPGSTYHEDGNHHRKYPDGTASPMERGQPLATFRGQLQLEAQLFGPGYLAVAPPFNHGDEPPDAALHLDARTLPEQVNVSLGLLEPGRLDQILPIWQVPGVELLELLIVPRLTPWLYIACVSVDDAKLQQLTSQYRR